MLGKIVDLLLVWAVWQQGSPLASWEMPVWEALPSSPGFSWVWSWSWSSQRCWGFTALSWPSSYLQNKCLHQTPSHSFHIKAARTNRRFSPTSITPRWSDRMGWRQKHVGGRLDSCVLSRCDLSLLFKAIQLCQVLCVQKGHEDVLVVVGWCVDSLLDLLSDLNLYSDPESLHPPVNVVTSLCCKCEYQRSSLCPFPLLWFLFFCWWFWSFLFWDCWIIVHISVLFFHVLFWDHFWIKVMRNWQHFFHYLWKVMKILT